MISLIKRIYKKEPNLYGKYFLSLEADDEPAEEEVTEENKPKRNVKVVQVKPNNRRKHFADVEPEAGSSASDDAPDIDDTSFNDSDTETTPNEDVNDEGNEDNFADDQPDNTGGAEANEDPEETGDDANNDDNGEDTPETGDETNFADMGEEDSGDDAPETDDSGDNFADTSGGDDGGDNNDESSADTAQEESNEKKKPGIEYDSTRKYNLFKEYMSLYNAADNYISKLENILKNDLMQNQIICICVNNLRDIKDILYDFMTIKFQNSSYIQSLIFYQKMILSVQLIFKLLKISNETKNNKNKTNGSKQ